MREPGIETRPLQEFPVRLFVLAASVAQPPLPLQEILPLQLASLVLQPPGLYRRLSFARVYALFAMVWRETPARVGAFAALDLRVPHLGQLDAVALL